MRPGMDTGFRRYDGGGGSGPCPRVARCYNRTCRATLFPSHALRSSSVVERSAVNRLVAGSSPACGRKQQLLETLLSISDSVQVILFTHEDDVRSWAEKRFTCTRDQLTVLASTAP